MSIFFERKLPRRKLSVIVVQIISHLLLQTASTPYAYGLKITLKQNVNLRSQDGRRMVRVGVLAKGSVVEIPDRFVVKKNNAPNLELTINNWLKNAEMEHKFEYQKNQSLNFFSIKVVKAAAGSNIPQLDQATPHFIALEYLVRQGSALVVSEDTDVVAEPRSEPQLEATTPCSMGNCSKPSSPIEKLHQALAPALTRSEAASQQIFNRTQTAAAHVAKNFMQTCGLPLADFLPVAKARAEKADIPFELLNKILLQESTGRCQALNGESDKSQSVGLFQINTLSTRVPRCTPEQKSKLPIAFKNDPSGSSAPRCLENPLVNLDEAIRVLNEKKSRILSGFANPLSSTDLWRLVASANNGGERWVFQAKRDLERFNATNGTQLDAHKWEDLRIFYLRSWLDRETEKSMFGTTAQSRSRKYSIANLAYAENLFPRRQ